MASTDTVTVACKLPNGLHLDVNGFDRVTIKGNALPFGESAVDYRIVGGYALTPGVPRDLWDAWLKDRTTMDIIVKGIVFAQEKPADVVAEAKNGAKVITGLEPIDPDKPGNGLERVPVGG